MSTTGFGRLTRLAGKYSPAVALACMVVLNPACDRSSLQSVPRYAPDGDFSTTPSGCNVQKADTIEAKVSSHAALPVFRVVKPDFDISRIRDFASRIIGTGPDRVPPSAVRVKPSGWTVDKTDGWSIDYDNKRCLLTADCNENKEDPVPGHTLTSSEEAELIGKARRILQEKKLDYAEAVPRMAYVGCQGSAGSISYAVSFNRRSPWLPYPNTSDSIRVELWPSRRLKGLWIEWREYQRLSDYPVLTADQAIEEMRSGRGIITECSCSWSEGDLKRCKTTKVEVSYWVVSDTLQPFYEFYIPIKSKGHEDGIWAVVQAVRPEYLAKAKETTGEDDDP